LPHCGRGWQRASACGRVRAFPVADSLTRLAALATLSRGVGEGLCRGRDDEHAAEREQRLAVLPPWIGGVDQRGVAGLEHAALRLLERAEQRREPGRFGVFLDRVLAVQHL